MQLINKLFSRHFYRTISFWILLALITYSAAGFWLAPYLINKVAVEQVEQRLGWQTKIQKIKVNPFKLDVDIEQFAVLDDQEQEVIGFSRFYINFTLRSLFEWAATFQEVSLVDPHLDLTINKDGSNNFAQALQKHAVPEQEQTEQEQSDSSGLFPVLFDNVSVINGAVKVNNNLPNTPVEHQVNPITFSLQNFSTKAHQDGQYQLDIVLDTEQTLHWKGDVSLNPIRSKGNLNISGIRVHRFSPYFQDAIPYQLNNGLAAVKGSYDFFMAGEKTELKINDASLDINDLIFHSTALQDDFLTIKHIHVGPSNFDLQAKNLNINEVRVEQLVLDILRDKKGQLPLLSALDSTTKTTQDKQAPTTTTSDKGPSKQTAPANKPEQASADFAWSVNKLLLVNNQVNWQDQQPAETANVSIKEVNLSLSGLNQDLSKPLNLNMDYLINDSKVNHIKGEITPVPLAVKSNLKLDSVNLKIAQPYVSEVAHVRLTKGLLFADLALQLALDKQGEMQTELSGSVQVDDFNSRDKLLNKRLLGWQSLKVSPMKVSLNPLAIDITKIALTQPYARMIVTEKRSTNIAGLMVKENKANNTQQAKQSTKKQAVLPLRIENIEIKEGAAYFADLSLKPQFGSGIEHMDGSIKGINSQSKTPAQVDIKGSIEDYGKMAVSGKFKPFANDLYTDIDVNFDKVELTTMTPYSGRYAGYVIDKGKLSLHLNYLIENRKLKGRNRLVLDQFELGKQVDSKESVNLPIKLALALFKDKNGVIDINLPTSGDIDDPNFKISGLLLKAFTNLINKAVTSPFSAIAGMVDGDPDKLNSVNFALGNASLSSEQKANLKSLAEVLNNRPQLILEMRVMVDESAEAELLKDQHLQEELKESGADLSNAQQRQQAIQSLYAQRTSNQQLTNLKKKVQSEIQAQQQGLDKKAANALFEKQYQQALHKALIKTQKLASLELLNLAKQRVSVIKKELIGVNKVANAQVYALNPSLQGKAAQGTIKTEFTLKSH